MVSTVANPASYASNKQAHPVIYAAGLCWVFYQRGYNYCYRTSSGTDENASWGPEHGLSGNDIAQADVWFSGTNRIDYAYIRGNTIRYRSGTLNSDSTITWNADEAIVGNYGPTNLSICLDSNGYVWIAYCTNINDPESGTYFDDINILRSSTNNGLWTGTSISQQLRTDSSGTAYYSTRLLPLTNGKIGVVYSDQNPGTIRIRTYNGSSFQAEASSDAKGINQVWNAVAYGNDIHVAMANIGVASVRNVYYAKYTYTANTLSNALNISEAIMTVDLPYVSISLYSSSISVFWVNEPAGNHVYYRCLSSSGSWGSIIDAYTDNTGISYVPIASTYSGPAAVLYYTYSGTTLRFVPFTLQTTNSLTRSSDARRLQTATLTQASMARSTQAMQTQKTSGSHSKQAIVITKNTDAFSSQKPSITKNSAARSKQTLNLTRLAAAASKQTNNLTGQSGARCIAAYNITSSSTARSKQAITITRATTAQSKQQRSLTKNSNAASKQTYNLTKQSAVYAIHVGALNRASNTRSTQKANITKNSGAQSKQQGNLTRNSAATHKIIVNITLQSSAYSVPPHDVLEFDEEIQQPKTIEEALEAMVTEDDYTPKIIEETL